MSLVLSSCRIQQLKSNASKRKTIKLYFCWNRHQTISLRIKIKQGWKFKHGWQLYMIISLNVAICSRPQSTQKKFERHGELPYVSYSQPSMQGCIIQIWLPCSANWQIPSNILPISIIIYFWFILQLKKRINLEKQNHDTNTTYNPILFFPFEISNMLINYNSLVTITWCI